jgi:spore coat polysaccharide biosynthesis protein SpsF
MIGLILQARINSSRLYGKVFFPLGGMTSLEFQIRRLKRINFLDKIILAVPKNEYSSIFRKIAKQEKCFFFEGSEKNVLKRYFQAATKNHLNTIVRVQADCPLLDPSMASRMLKFYIKNINKYDYVSNILKPSYPIGMHFEIFSYKILKIAYENSVDEIEQEHVTPYIYRRPKYFRLKNIFYKNNKYRNLRLTLDYFNDYSLIRNIVNKLFYKKNLFNLEDIINFYKKNKNLFLINSKYKKKSIIL